MGVTLSAAQAAKKVGKSTPTITRAIKSGKLSATKLEGGGYEIDPAELFRVFDPISKEGDDTPTMKDSESDINDSVLQARLEVTEQRLDDAQKTIEDLRRRLDEERQDRREVQRLLTHETQQKAERVSWLERLTGRNAG